MPDTYAGNASNYPAAIQRPVGTDLANAASVRMPLTQLSDRTAYLENQLHTVQRFNQVINRASPVPNVVSVGTTWHIWDSFTIANIDPTDTLELSFGPVTALVDAGTVWGSVGFMIGATIVDVAVSETSNQIVVPIWRNSGQASSVTVKLMARAATTSGTVMASLPRADLVWCIGQLLRDVL